MSEKKLALVTGGTGGLGTAICRRLQSDGFLVVAGYFGGGNPDKARAWQEQQRAEGFDIAIQYGDVSDWASSVRMIDEVRRDHGRVEVLVNNAGITRDASLRKMTEPDWRAVLEANLFSVFNVTRQVIDDMVQGGFGRVINISSINGEKGQFGQTNYSAAKAGMHGFTKALALEVASKGVTVNTISPGYIETDMIHKLDDAIREQIRKQIPVGRFGQPEDVARMVAFLADEEAGYVTGANFSINGGQHMH